MIRIKLVRMHFPSLVSFTCALLSIEKNYSLDFMAPTLYFVLTFPNGFIFCFLEVYTRQLYGRKSNAAPYMIVTFIYLNKQRTFFVREDARLRS